MTVADDPAAFVNARLDEGGLPPPVTDALRAILGRHCRIEPLSDGAAACAWCSDDVDAGARWHQPWPCPDVRSLAAIWDYHPAYRQEWAPGVPHA
jgi:hypothetical protein